MTRDGSVSAALSGCGRITRSVLAFALVLASAACASNPRYAARWAFVQKMKWVRADAQEGAPGDGLAFLTMHRVMLGTLRATFPEHAHLFGAQLPVHLFSVRRGRGHSCVVTIALP